MEIVKYFSLVDAAWAAAPPSAAVSDLDIIPLILNAGPVVKAVMLILLLFSVACWGIIFAKLVQLSRAKKQTAEFLDSFGAHPTFPPPIMRPDTWRPHRWRQFFARLY